MLRAITALARAEHHYRVGEWDKSVEVIEESMAVLDEGWESRTAPMVLAVGSFVHAGRGDWDAARGSLSQAETLMAGPGHFTARMWVAIGRARLAIAVNDPVAVVEACRRWRRCSRERCCARAINRGMRIFPRRWWRRAARRSGEDPPTGPRGSRWRPCASGNASRSGAVGGRAR